MFSRLACGALALCAAACASQPLATAEEDDPAPVVLRGDVTSEALHTMLVTPALYWEWSAGNPLTPEAGSLLDAPAEFTWATDLVHLAAPAAEPAPLTGVAFLMRFWSDSDPTLLNVFTTFQSFTPDGESWALLAGASQPITVRIDSADFEANRIVEDRGPFYGRTLEFGVVSSPE